MATQLKAPKVSISLLCLYTHQDTAYKEQLAAYLERLKQLQKIDHLKYREVDEFVGAKLGVEKLIARVDLILLIVTPQFLASDFSYSSELSQLLEAKTLKNVELIPLVFTPCRTEGSILHKLDRLSSNAEPLLNEHTRKLEQPLFVISGELETKIERIRFHKGKVEQAWQKARSINEYNSYQDFVNQFPFSLYSAEAKKRADEMLEDKLWKEAKAFDNITHLLHYLKDAPNIAAKAEHKLEALDRINEIETDEANAGAEALKSRELPLLMDYLRRFPHGSQATIAHSEVGELVADLLAGKKRDLKLSELQAEEESREEELISTEAFRIRHLTRRILKPEELLELDSYYQFGEGLLEKAEKLNRRLKGNAGFLILVIPSFLLFAYMTWLMLGARILGMGWMIYLLAIFSAALLYTLIVGSKYMNDDARLCSNIAQDLNRKLTELRVSFLFHDRPAINRLLFELLNVQGQLNRLSALRMEHYLLGKKEEGPKEIESGKLTIEPPKEEGEVV